MMWLLAAAGFGILLAWGFLFAILIIGSIIEGE